MKEKIEAPEGKPQLNYYENENKVESNFTQVPNEILFGLGKYETLKPSDVRVYAVLLHQIKFRLEYNKQVDEDGHAYCFLTQDQLGEKANIKSRKTVGECVERLTKLGLVHAVWRGKKKCYMYYIALPDKIDNDEKILVDVNEIGKKLTDEQRAENKAKRESKRKHKNVTKKQVAELKQVIQSDGFEMPDTPPEDKRRAYETTIELLNHIGFKFHKANRMPELKTVVEKHFGVGKKVKEATEDELPLMNLVYNELVEVLDEQPTIIMLNPNRK
ncbi:replication initiator protein A [Bacillus nitratireducens]|uniref:replication initiator protein A n=1 Tax=Bacillus nitratireducens TaxID=2026193 RepID=UPI00089531CE|nr:hypothetical protein [Bacillus nitratireducens]SDZ85503.1 hypothetical protein SAMN04488146_101322 [Bacillus nitratireducens]